MLEKEIEDQVLLYLKKYAAEHKGRVFFWKQHTVGIWDSKKGVRRKSNNQFVITGIADIIVCYYGLFVGLEVKAVRGRLRPSQKEFGDNIKRAQGIYKVVRSVDEVRSALEAIEEYFAKKNSRSGEITSQIPGGRED